ncbi:MAG TPA: ATP-binding protein [Alphaproteobacteria bacterium]|jgi:signal transduction histidine kinase/CheY-like chemotaxis protein|nr:ATP-binding protein [Alphaproteobacteria bacterium]
MDARILTTAIEHETDIIVARQRTRTIAAKMGFDAQDQTRITTAVSEIVRNALEYAGGGRIEYRVRDVGLAQMLEIVVFDKGPGISHIADVLAGRHRSTTGMGVGIVGARRLMDDFAIDTAADSGTKVVLGKRLPPRARRVMPKVVAGICETLAVEERLDPINEIRNQNREALIQLGELQRRQEELEQLNQELQDTNRGVVALYAELDERADHLRRADQLKSRFLSNMSHEFRTPLNSILSLSRLLLDRVDGELTAEQEKQVTFIRKAAENLTELVNDLLDIARVEAGKVVVTPKEFTVGDLFGALRGMLRPLLVGDAVTLVFEDPKAPLPLITDEGKVSQILRNFLSNAIKFTERGEVRVSTMHDAEKGTVTFEVKDSGVGIAPEDIGAIWEEFEQVANHLQGRTKGTGLGLPLAKRLATLLGGSVSVESVPGQGSTFRLTVPRVFVGAREEAAVTVEWKLEPDRLPVLALEDNAADAFSIERALAHSRYQAIPARDIAEARRVLERVTPSAILLDVMLATEESWRFLIEMKHNDKTHGIPIIVVSTTDEERKARSFGADDYISKPADPGRLIRALDAVTGSHSVTKVLLVDDEEMSRYVVRQLLPRGAFDLQEAATALDGLQKAATDVPDVILFDLKMDNIDGFAFLERLGKAEKLSHVPAVAITSMHLGENDRRRLARSAKVISKHELTTDVLVGAIRSALDRVGSPAP